MLNTVVSVGWTRLFGGIGLGADRLVRLAIVVVVVDARLMRIASGSVPVLTDQRSTPHVAAATVAFVAVEPIVSAKASTRLGTRIS